MHANVVEFTPSPSRSAGRGRLCSRQSACPTPWPRCKSRPAPRAATARPAGATAEAGKPQDEFSDNITLPTDNLKKNKLLAIIDYIEERNWEIAITESAKDYRPARGRVRAADAQDRRARWSPAGPASRARPGGCWPRCRRQGLEFYRLKQRPAAARMLKEAKETSDINKLTEVMNRFLHTSSGPRPPTCSAPTSWTAAPTCRPACASRTCSSAKEPPSCRR